MQLLLYNIAIILVLFEFFFDTEYLQGKFLIYLPTVVILFHQIENVLKDSTAFVYVTKSEISSHLCKMT